MTEETKELCKRASVEKDFQTLLELANEITGRLQQEGRGLNERNISHFESSAQTE